MGDPELSPGPPSFTLSPFTMRELPLGPLAWAKGQLPALRFKQHNRLSSGLWFLTCRPSTRVYGLAFN